MNGGVNLANKGLNGAVCETDEGGLAVRLINKTGAASIKGTAVCIDGTTAFGVTETVVAATNNFGIIAESGIADGSDVWVTFAGKALVAFHDNVGVKGNYVRTPIAADAANAVKEKYTFLATHAATAAGSILVKLPSLTAVSVALVGNETVNQVATAIAAATFTGWTTAALNATVTFEQSVAATTDGVSGFTAAGTGVTETVTRTAIGKPAIVPTDGIAVATGTIPGAGLQIGFLLEDHTARRYADDLALAMCVLKSN